MHTLQVIAGGFVLLAVCYFAGRGLCGLTKSRAIWLFIGLWLIASLFNMTYGAVYAGYGFAAEFPIFLVVFAIPAIVAVLVLKFSRS